MRPSACVNGIVVLLALASPLARRPAPVLAFDERRVSPYFDYGPLDLAQRAARHHALGAAAAAAGDLAGQARHVAMECVSQTLVSFDPRMTHPACVEARRLARVTGLLDVQLTLDGIPPELILKSLNAAAAEPLLAAIIARGATLDPAAPEARPVRRARLGRGVALTQLGRYDEAGAEFARTREESRQTGDEELLGVARVWDCWGRLTHGEIERAHAECEAARDQLARSYDLGLDFDLGYVGGLLRAEEGDPEGALADYRRTVTLSEHPGGGLRGPVARTMVTSGLIELGRLQEARAYLEAIDRDVAAGRFFPGLVPLLEHQWAKLERASHRPVDALPHFIASGRSTEHFVSIWAFRGQAWAHQQLGNLAGARAALEEAIRRLEAERISVADASVRARISETHASIYRDLVSVRWEMEGHAAAPAALEIAEAGRARALLDALASAQVSGAAAPTLSASAVQATLAPGEVLIEYVSSEDRLFAITVTSDRIALTPLPLAGTAEDLARRVDFFSALVQQSDEAALDPAARRLEADILTPALAAVAPAAHTLLIAADGPLHRLPFDALGSSPRVIDRWDVVMLPSASVLAGRPPGAAPSAAALVVAAPADSAGFAPLPAAPAEAAAIRHRLGGEIVELTGAGATQAHLEAIGPARFAVLHFASHALVDQVRPLRSALVLAPPAPGADGRWSAADIYRTKLAADLVVLSACATAAGAQVSGEGVMSLARAFLYAGAGATIATLWDVPDAPGPIFADVLYAALARNEPLGAAVAGARRELRRRGAPPRAWAAYTVTGNPAGRVRVTGRADPGVVVGRVTGGLALLMLVVASIRRQRSRGRVGWPVAAMASAALAVATLTLLVWPARAVKWNADVPADRGGPRAAFAPTIVDGRVRWPPVTGADEYVVERFDEAGLAIGRPAAAVSPFPIPTAGGWIRLEARHQRRPLTRSMLIRVSGTRY